VLGRLADSTSIEFVYRVCSVLPALGLLTVFLPDMKAASRTGTAGRMGTASGPQAS
jgi:MFS transporter, FSR family, fosmidomycin resistance protein